MTHNPEQSERLNALAARCEAADGPDRELDALIVTTLCPDATVSEYIAGEGDDIVFHAETLGIRNKDCCPWYTHSLDAAMTLVPEGCDWLLDNFDGECGKPSAWVHRRGSEGDITSITGATPALALCAAALRAHAYRKESTHD